MFADIAFTVIYQLPQDVTLSIPPLPLQPAVEFTSQLASGCTMTQETMKWLLQKNVELHFGAMGLMLDNTVVFSHTLPGCSLSKEAFEATIRTVATIADHYDDEVVAMAGGKLGRHSGEEIASEAAASV